MSDIKKAIYDYLTKMNSDRGPFTLASLATAMEGQFYLYNKSRRAFDLPEKTVEEYLAELDEVAE